jgi:hypothetical protein
VFSQGSPPPHTGQGGEFNLTGADALAFARRRYSGLSGDGVRVYYPGAKPQVIEPDQVETAMRFLKKLLKTKRASVGVGSLKHDCENWGREHGLCGYISRGALISAAVALNYPVSPHAIGVSKKDLSRLINEVRDLRRERLAAGK